MPPSCRIQYLRLKVPYTEHAVLSPRGFKCLVLRWGALSIGFAIFHRGLVITAAAYGAGSAMGGHWPEPAAAVELLAEPDPRLAEMKSAVCEVRSNMAFLPNKQVS